MSLWSYLFVTIIISSGYLTSAQDATTTEPTTEEYENYTTVTSYEALEIHIGNETADVDRYNKYETINSEAENETVLSSVFNITNYVNVCSPNQTRLPCHGEVSVLCERCGEDLKQAAVKICESFQDVVRNMMVYSCYFEEQVRKSAIDISETYLQICGQFLKNIDYTTLGEHSEDYINSMDTVRRMMEALDLSDGVKKGYMNVVRSMNKVINFQNNVGPLNRSEVYADIEKEQTSLIQYLEDDIPNVKNYLIYLQENKLETVFNSDTLAAITDFHSFEDEVLPVQKQHLEDIKVNLVQQRKVDIIQTNVRVFFVVILLLVGLSGNFLLLLVFIKYKDMRTIANLMLINLTIVDSICLLINLPVAYYRSSHLWELGPWGCKAFYYLRMTVILVSTYSVVMISFQRFLAVNSFPKAGGCTIGHRAKTFMMVTSVWLIGLLYGIPRLMYSDTDNGMCVDTNNNVFYIIITVDFVFICIIPSISITTFSVLTASTIKKSVSQAPGERTGQEQLKKDRMLSAHVLTGLAVLFIISYFPNFIFYFITQGLKVEIETVAFNILDNIVYYLQFANACLNPVSLGIMSKKYRKCYFELFGLCKVPIKLREQSSSVASVATTESAI